MLKLITELRTLLNNRRNQIAVIFLCILVILYVKRNDHRTIALSTLYSVKFEATDDIFRPRSSDQPEPRPPSVTYIDLKSNDNLARAKYDPFPVSNDLTSFGTAQGEHRPCLGPRGVDVNGNADDMLAARFVGPSSLNPNPLFGSYEEGGLDNAHCFDHSSRFGPYGIKSNNYEAGRGSNSTNYKFVDWERVDWGNLQSQCIERNKDRFQQTSAKQYAPALRYPAAEEAPTRRNFAAPTTYYQRNLSRKAQGHRDMKAVVIRSYDQIGYTPECLQHMRAMISELSLQTGGEYSVYLLVEVKDSLRPIFFDTSAYEQALNDYVPPEFRNITVLWNQAWLEAWYPKINPVGYQTQHANQPLQLFSIQYPEFAYVWEIELDVRYTGHWYNLISNAESWARAQPRKLQWERAAQYYIPWYHGSYTNFSDSIAAASPDGGIWGPIPNDIVARPLGPAPPTQTSTEDDFAWGVGEDADIIAPAPIIDTDHTSIFFTDLMAGFSHNSTRRALMTTPVRCLSRALLKIMHDGQVEQGLHQRSEMFPHNMALLHGLKISSYPLPTFVDDRTTKIKDGTEANKLFNAVGRYSTFSNRADQKSMRLREGISFWWRLTYLSQQYSQALYLRWYGLGTREHLCLPGMLLHPVKDVG